MPVNLDDLLGTTEPHATFHDASLLALRIDYGSRDATLDWELFAGDPDTSERKRTRRARLKLSGLVFWEVEPFHDAGELPDLADDGPLTALNLPRAMELSRNIPPGALAWYLYFSNWNAFAYCCARTAEVEWPD